MLDDRQSQTGPAGRLTATFIDAIKALSQARDMLGVDTRPLIFNEQCGSDNSVAPRHRDRSFTVLQGIHDQIADGTAQLRCITQHTEFEGVTSSICRSGQAAINSRTDG